MKKHFILFTVSFALLSCNENELPKAYQLDKLRILAIHADSPELADSALPASVNITTYVSDTNGDGRVLQFTAAACPDPGVAYGAEPTCDGNPLKVDLAVPDVTATSQAANSGIFGLPNLTGAIPAFSVAVPTGLLTGRSAIDQYNGVAYLVTIKVRGGGESARSFKRIFVSTKPTQNSNPTISDIKSNGASLATLPSGEVELTSTIGTAETYTVKSADGDDSRTERLYTSWYVNKGELKSSITLDGEESKWT
ncbi:MAG: hypothetical protein AB7O96_16100, partial [Pseudobdellovibrionaceae bacterium]